jgi:DNA-binding transcriptional ArsR family regulator
MAEATALGVIRGAATAALMLQPTRRLVLENLDQPRSAAGLARLLGLPRQKLNYHLRELEREGLAECVEERRKGNCTERLLRATARAFVISPEALGALGPRPEAAADRFSAAYLIAAAARTVRDVGTFEAGARAAGKRVATLTLEADVRFASAAARAAFAQELSAAVAALAARYHDETAPGGRRFHLLAAVHPAVSPAPAPRAAAAGRRRTASRRKKP